MLLELHWRPPFWFIMQLWVLVTAAPAFHAHLTPNFRSDFFFGSEFFVLEFRIGLNQLADPTERMPKKELLPPLGM